jgi:hypothetical protein
MDWLALDINKESVLLITNKLLDKVMYFQDKAKETVTWKDCSLFRYLNGEFLNMLPNGVQDSLQDKGNGKIFLLDDKEVEKYFIDNSGRIAMDEDRYNGGEWLREPIKSVTSQGGTIYEDRVACGTIVDNGYVKNADICRVSNFWSTEIYRKYCVRPAMWVKL